MTEAQTWAAIVGLLVLLGSAMSWAFALMTRTFTAELNRGLAEVRTEIRSGLAEVRTEIADLRGEVRVLQHRFDARGA